MTAELTARLTTNIFGKNALKKKNLLHLPNSPDLSLCDLYLFEPLKEAFGLKLQADDKTEGVPEWLRS